MLIVLEGCDGVGKTTLAKQLQKLLDAKIIHCSSTTPNDYDYFKNIIISSRGQVVIADRFCYGQFVYQQESERPLGREMPSLDALHALELVMLRENVKVIHVKADPDTVKERLAMRKETVINNLSVDEVLAGFEAIKKLSSIEWLEYSTGGNADV